MTPIPHATHAIAFSGVGCDVLLRCVRMTRISSVKRMNCRGVLNGVLRVRWHHAFAWLCVFVFAGCHASEPPRPTLSTQSVAMTDAIHEPDPASVLQGKWKVDNVESGDPMVMGEHPWNIVDLTITGDSYLARRSSGTVEQGLFDIVRHTTPRQVLFFNWGHREEPRRAVFDSPGTGILRVCMYTKEYGSHNSLVFSPHEVAIHPQAGAGYDDTVLYTFTRE